MFVLWRFGPVRLYRGKREPAGALRRWSPRNVIFTAAETLFSRHRSLRTQPGPTVRIHLSPADSPCLAQTGPLQVETRGFPAGLCRWAGGAVGRDAQGSSTSRQLPVRSLSGAIPVPQCRLGGSRSWVRRAPLIVPSATGDRRRIRHISARSHCLGNKRMLRL